MENKNNAGRYVTQSNNGAAIPSYSNDDYSTNEVAFNGLLEVSHLTDIDNAIANKIGAIINRLHISSPDHVRNKRLALFAARPINEKLAMGEFESPRRFLMTLSKQRSNNTGQAKTNNVQLPYLYVTRAPGIYFAEPEKYKDASNIADVCDSTGTLIGQLDQSVTALTYQLNIVGWQNDNIDAIAMLIMSWLRHTHEDHTFTAKTVLGGIPYELGIEVTDRHLVTAESASVSFEEDKLRALSVTLTVDAEVAIIRYGSESTAKILAGSIL
ncbi:hypothetical protein HWV00_21135 (plasmid) [Moritella sp. 24]|uniref:hypothetical protein n=1 Tax=Moritella sp. 24 TaxID=2746230 RepID=UPI001BAC6447|nr:hypothetical protein [Moritella sp. 24]QUM78780.1 hypothetical protein HWV00_21135 [Moritella sp. 24]